MPKKLTYCLAIGLALLLATANAATGELLTLGLEKDLSQKTSNGQSLLEIIEHLREKGKRPVVAFDMDGTLSTLGPSEGYGQAKLRGGEATRRVLEKIVSEGVPWFVTSANQNKAAIGSKINKLGLYDLIKEKFNDDCRGSSQGSSISDMHPRIINEHYIIENISYKIIQCHNAIAAVKEGDQNHSPDKQVAMEYILSHFFDEINEPNVIIHIDDNAGNLERVYKYYQRHASKDIHYIGILWEPHIPEPDHAAAMKWMNSEMRRSARPK